MITLEEWAIDTEDEHICIVKELTMVIFWHSVYNVSQGNYGGHDNDAEYDGKDQIDDVVGRIECWEGGRTEVEFIGDDEGHVLKGYIKSNHEGI